MRGGKSLLVLLVIALGLGAYIYFVEAKRNPDETATKHDKVFTVPAGKIDQIDVHSASGETTTLKKQGTNWQITAPVSAPADQSAASSLASSLESLEIQTALGDNPSSLAQYGLQPARASVTFHVSGDATPHTLELGNKTPTGSDLYARVTGQPKLFLISSYLDDTFNRTTFELQDKTALKFNRDDVDAITIDAAGSPALSLTKKSGDWHIATPGGDLPADYSSVDAIVSRLAQAQMKAIVGGNTGAPPSDKDLKTYGLDKPALVASVGAGSTRASLAIGGKKDDSTVYARDLSKPIVFTLDAAIVTDLKKTPDDLRLKDVFQFKSFDALAIDITQGGTATSFAKSKPAGGDQKAADVWKETKPAAKDVNQTAMDDLLNTLSSLRADHFVDQSAAASASDTVVSVRYGDEKQPSTETVTFRKTGDTVQAIKAGQPGAAVVPTADFDKAMTQLKDLTGGK
jgi:hypothetical protein